MGGIVSIKKNSDFRRIYKRGKSRVTPTLVVYAVRGRRGGRLGLTAGKKVGCAARRNRAKRRLRALYRELILNGGLLPEGVCLDMVVVARAAAADCAYDQLRRDFICAVKSAAERINFKNSDKNV